MNRHAVLAAGLVALATAGCSTGGRLADPVDGTVAPRTTIAAVSPPDCPAGEQDLDPTRSFEPIDAMPDPGDMPAGSTMAAIQERGRLVVGVSGDTLRFGARNSQNGRIEGFDVDLLREVAKAIFGVGDAEVDDHIEFKVIPYRDRLPRLESRDVDVVAHTMTINCPRWQRIAFSAEYYHAGQRLLVPMTSSASTIEALASVGATICVPDGSTNEEYLRQFESSGITITDPLDITDCLVQMQQGLADATTGDDTVLAGLAAQDPNLVMVGDLLTDEPYGLGFNREDVDFVRFVNGLLEQLHDNGRWQELHRLWLGADGDQPVPVYGREPST